MSRQAGWFKPSNHSGGRTNRGWILSTLLTLLIVSAGFSLADGLEKRLGPWLRRRVLTYKPGEADDGILNPQAAEWGGTL